MTIGRHCRLATALLMGAVGLTKLAHGAEVLVTPSGGAAAITAAALAAQPGDVIVMQDGVWPDADILFATYGTEAQPVTLRAQTLGRVHLTGQSRLRMAGSYLVVDGLIFTNGYRTSGDVIAFRDSSSSVAFNSKLINSAIIDYNPPNPTNDTKWVSLYGASNRVENCHFRGKTNVGTTLIVWVSELPDPNNPNYHVITRNYFGPRPLLTAASNGGETIRVGTSDFSMNISRTTVEDNFFERCNGDVEIISSKSCENTYRRNTFWECEGALTLRHGNSCTVEGNYFFGNQKTNTGGVRIVGENHRVFNNYFESLRGSSSRAPLVFMQGLPNSPLNGYFQVSNATVAFNTFVNCNNTFVVGLSGTVSGQPTSLPPKDSTVANNIALQTSGRLVDLRLVENFTWTSNLFSGATLGITNAGVLAVNALLVTNGVDGIYRPSVASPALGNAAGGFDFVTADFEGQARPLAGKDIGADQASVAPRTSVPLSSLGTGPLWMRVSGSVVSWPTPAPIFYGTTLGGLQLNAQANAAGTLAYNPPAGMLLAAGSNQMLRVVFTPVDTVNFSSVTQQVLLNVLQAPAVVMWAQPADLIYGAALSGAQLNASANVAGSLAYNPTLGTVLNAGTGQVLRVVFTPNDVANFASVTQQVLLNVTRALPNVSWPVPASVEQGSILGGVQLNASVAVPGSFVYAPAAGTVLSAGSGQILSTVFTPADGANYFTVTQTVEINVTIGGRTLPHLIWAQPTPVLFGTPLGALQLNASANVSGTFTYTPPPGTVLPVGNGQVLRVTFTPNDEDNFIAATQSVTLSVAPLTSNTLLRVAYVVPFNRAPQAHAAATLRGLVRQYQEFFATQMANNGFGRKSFTLETEADGVTPVIHVLTVQQSDSFLRGDIYGQRVLDAARGAGLPVGAPGQLWWLIPEVHVQNPDGTMGGSFELGVHTNTLPISSGWAISSSEKLALYQTKYQTNALLYDGRTVPELGPYPLVQDVSFPWFEGITLSGISSSVLGSGLRSLGSAFGLPHDFRNDENFNGNLMGFGFRGIRGVFHPELYLYNYCTLSYASALNLSVNAFFNPGRLATDIMPPNVSVTTSGPRAPFGGLLDIEFTATDDQALHSAVLTWEQSADFVMAEEMLLNGPAAGGTFSTSFYSPGQTNRYRVTVYDRFGNQRAATTTIVPSVPVNQAPQPFIRVRPVIAGPGEDVLLDASQTFDPEHTVGFLEVEWDLTGDGNFDTAPTSELAGLFNFSTRGSRLIRARLTDPAGDTAISAPVALNIVDCQTDLSPTSRSHGYGGGANKVTVTAGPKCRWLPVTTNDWITLTNGNYPVGRVTAAPVSCYEAVGPSPVGPRVDGPEFTGTVVLNYTLAANPLFTERRGYIFIGDQIYTVIQQPAVCTFSISPTNRFHGYGSGGTGTIKVTPKASCPWTAINTNSWITITSGGSGTGTGTVNYVLGENRVTGRRSGNIVIDDRVFTVSQWGTNCEVAVNPATREHSASPETVTNTISTASLCQWVVVNTNGWISILSPLSGNISSNLIYSVAPNFGAETRTGVVTVNGETLTITQSACSLSIEPAARAHLFSAATGSICVAAGPICAWSVSTTNSWVSILSGATGLSTGRVDYVIEANPISVARVGVISVAGYEFLITQDPKPCYFAVTNLDEARSESFGESGGDSAIYIYTDTGCNWTAVSDSPWISILDGSSGSGSGTVIFVVARNDGPARSGIITVADEDYNITQASGVRDVRLTDMAVASGQTNAIYVILDAHGGENTLAFSLCYDTNLLAFAAASLLPSAPLPAVLTVANQQTAQGRVGLTVAMPNGFSLPAGTGTVVKVLLAGKPVNGKPYTTVSVCDAPVARSLTDAGFPPTPLTANFGSSTVRVLGLCSLAEALDVTNLTFVTGPIPWGCQAEVTHDLEDAAVSGAVPAGGESYFETTVTGPGTLNFWWKVSSELDNDRLRFYMDGGTQFTLSGEVNWEARTFSVPAGAHTFRWRYNKNVGTITNGQDRAWVDQVVYEAAPPSITSQPGAQAVDQGATATFTVAVAGQAPFTYQWRLNNAPLVENSVIRGTITPTLTLSNVQPSQVGNYSVVITTASGALVSSNAPLTVTPLLPLPEALDTTFTITSSGNANWVGQALVSHDGVDAGRSGPITHNQSSSFQTIINGPGTLRFWWKVSSESGDRLRFLINGTEQTSITGDVDWQEKIYTLGTNAQTLLWSYAKNSSGSLLADRGWVDEIRFIPQGVAITAQPTNQITDQGTNAIFTVGVSGTPPIYYQWLFNNAPIPGANSAALNIPNVQPANNGLYSVFVTNAAGSATSSNASLQVNLTVPLAEALDTTNLTWTTTTTPAGAAPWIGQVAISHDGTDAARTGIIGDSVTTTLATTLTGPGTFYFWWKVSSQGGGSDRLRFYINGSAQEDISGEVDWTFRSWTIPSGANQTVDFRYQKNASGKAGLDLGWVDQIRYVPNSTPTAPFFVIQPASRTVVVPAGVSFNALAGGSTPLSYQWQLNGVPLTNGTGIAGATTTNLALSGAAAAVAGNYSVLVTNSAGATLSAPATLTVITAPFITNAPVDRYVVAGSNAVFNVGALGLAPLSYQWMRSGSNLLNGSKFSGTTTSNLTVLSAQVVDEGIYSVVVSNAAGTASSLQGQGTLTVWSAARSGVLANSENTLLEANVTGPGTIKFLWKVSSQTNSDSFLFLRGATELARISGEVDFQPQTFAIPAGAHTLRWQYVKDASGSAGSDAGFLDNVEFISDTAVAPQVTGQPTGRTVFSGSTVSFDATVTGSMPLTYQWRLNGTPLLNSASIGGAQTPRLTLSGLTLGQAGNYSLLVSNAAGVVTSSNAALVVNSLPAGNAPVITTPPTSYATSENASVTFTVAATGAAPLTYQWFLNGAPLATVAGASPVSGATTASLSLSNVQATQAGNYTVVVSNAVGTATARASLSVLTLGEAAGAPYIAFAQAGNASWIAETSATAHDGVDDVRSGVINHGENSRLETYVEGPGTVTFWWKVSCEASDDNLRFYIGASEIIRISGEVAWEQKTYAVPAGTQLLKWRYGKGTSGTAGQDASWVDDITYTPSTINVAPVITNQPVSLSLRAGHTAVFGAGVGGSMPLTFQWRSNGVPVLNGNGVSGARGPRLTIFSAPAQSASYSLFVSNAAGTATSAVVTLNATSVLSAPVLSLQPTNRSVTEGESASFSILASGALPLTYQWLLNGVPLVNGAGVSGATTTTLSLNNVQAAHIGTYSAVVSNSAGTAVSSPASLTVLTMSEVVGAPYLNLAVIGQPWLVQNGSTYTPGTTNGGARLIVSVPASITAQPAGQSVVEGNDATFTIGAAGSPPLFLQWRLNGVALFDGNGLSGVNSNTLVISGVQPVDAGNYSVTVSNAVGFVTSTNAALIVLTPPSITTPPAALTVAEGAPASFTVVAAGTAPFTYQWKRNGTNIVNGGSVGGATTATLTLNNAQPLQGGLYSVAISNVAGGIVSSPIQFSVIAALTVGEAMNAPYLTWSTDLGAPWTVQTNVTHDDEAAAQSGTIVDGASSTLETTVVGPGTIRFWWRVSSQTNADHLTFSANGSTWAQISGLGGWQYQSFVVPGGLVNLRWTYSKDAGGVAGSDRGWLDEVDFVPSSGPSVPVIVQEPVGVEVNPGENVSFSIQALGTAPLSYQWRFEGQELGDGGNILGSKTPTLTISAVQQSQAGLYDVVVRNPYSLDISENVFLSVIPVISLPVALDTDHTNMIWVSGATVGGLPWRGQTNVKSDLIDAAVSGTIGHGMTSWVQTVVSGPGAISFFWKCSSETNQDRMRFTIDGVEAANISGETDWRQRTFTINDPGTVLRWSYTKSATGVSGLDRAWLDQVVFGPTAPIITNTSQNLFIVDVGTTVRFNVAASGTTPFSYQWSFIPPGTLHGTNLLNGDTNFPIYPGFLIGAVGNRRLTVSNAQPEQSGTYEVEVLNPAGSAVSPPFTLQVIPSLPLAQALNTNLVWETYGYSWWVASTNIHLDGLAARSGSMPGSEATTLKTTVQGPGTLSFWWKASTETNVDILSFEINGSTTSGISGNHNWAQKTYDLDSGTFVLTWTYNKSGLFTNGLDTVFLDQVVFAPIAPIITNQPVARVIDQGSAVSFTAGVRGTPPLSYQWLLNGVPLVNGGGISGARSLTLNLSGVPLAQAGSYVLQVSNVVDVVSSAAAALTVLPTFPIAEAIDNADYVWTTGSPGWIGQNQTTFDGIDAVKSPTTANSGSSTMQATIAGPGTVQFKWKVSSQTNNGTGGDELIFYTNNTALARISGEAGWEQRSFSILPGSQIVKWTYAKNATLTNGQDRGWVDQFVFIPTAPTVTTSPVGTNVDQGASATFTVGVYGTPPLTYQWRYNGGDIVGANGATLTLNTVQPGQAGNYSVVVGNAAGTANSLNAALTVNTLVSLAEALDTTNFVWATSGSPAWVGQIAVAHDGSDSARIQSVPDSGSASVQTTILGPGTISFWWKVSSQTNGDYLTFYTNGVLAVRISGEQDWETRAINLGSGNQTLTWTYAKNSSAVAGQDRAWLDQVAFGPVMPTVTVQPVSRGIDAGNGTSFAVTVAGTPPFTYQWQRNGVDLANGAGLSGVNTSNLVLTAVQSGQAGAYRVLVNGQASGTVSSAANLTVYSILALDEALDTPGLTWTTNGTPPWIGHAAVTHDNTDAARSGAIGHSQSTSMSTILNGPGAVSFWWKVSSQTNGDYLTFFTNGVLAVRISGEQDWQFKTVNLGSGAQTLTWTYAKNGSTTNGEDRAYVDQVSFGLVAPTIITQPGSVTAEPGSNVTFTVVAAATPPVYYQWLFNGSPLVNSPGLSGATTASLIVSNVGANAVGTYSVVVSNSVNRVTSSGATLTLSSNVTINAALDGGLAFTTGGTATAWKGQTGVTRDGVDAAQTGATADSTYTFLKVTVTGPGPLSFWWKCSTELDRDYLRFMVDGVDQVKISGEQDWQLINYNVPTGSHELQWRYSKNSSLVAGQDRGWLDYVWFNQTPPPIIIVTTTPPAIVMQPASQSVEAGDIVTLSVATTGSSPKTYRWFHNVTNLVTDGPTIGGATTAELTLYNIAQAQAGHYTVAITNSAGAAATTPALVTVLPVIDLAEALDSYDLFFTTVGEAGWIGHTVVTHDGTDAARTGRIFDNQSSTLETMILGPGTLSFWWKVSSETNADQLTFYLNGVPQQSISGEVGWQQRTYPLGAGTQLLEWTYLKNGSLSTNADRGWLDQIVYNDTPPVTNALSVSNLHLAVDGNTLSIHWEGSASKTYKVYYKEALSDPTWTLLDTEVLVTWKVVGGEIVPDVITATANDGLGTSMRFYRVQEQ